MSEKIASELRSWFLTLGFEDRNLSTDQIEEEFRRLSPPELRDIWRSIMVHVVPVKEARYIKKVLILHELNKFKADKKKTLLIPKTIKSFQELEQFKSCEEIFSRLKKCHKNIAKCENEIIPFKVKVTNKELERTKLLKKKEKLDHIHILNDLKIGDREKTIKELLELHAYLNYINSFWRTEKNAQEDVLKDRLEIVKDCLRNVNEFAKQRNILQETDLIKEKENLMNNIVRLTSNIPISNLYKIIIEMLKDTLSSLLKLADHVNSRQDAESSWLAESKLTELKKECVQYFLKNFDNRKRLQNLQNEVDTYKLELFDALNNKNYMGFQKETFKTWLDSECRKHRMVTRESHFRKEFHEIKNRADKIVDFSNEIEKSEFFASHVDPNNQMIVTEQEIVNNIIHLSDEPINMFINCQHYCTNRIDRFIKNQKPDRLLNFTKAYTESVTNELTELRQLELQAILSSVAVSETNKYDDLPDYYVSFSTEQCYYIIYLTDRYKSLTEKFGQPVVKPESLCSKKIQIIRDQEKFLSIMQKSVCEAKNNLINVEKYATECSKNIGLWIELSANDIIPKRMMVANRDFADWLKRYVSVIQCLRKKYNKTSNS